MSIKQHPVRGSVLMCDFSGGGFVNPEMNKKRPVIVLSPAIKARPYLCTVVSLSTSEPDHIMPYHQQIRIRPPLPRQWSSDDIWVKGDMVNAVGFHRLDLIRLGKDENGKRIYHIDPIEEDQFNVVQQCVLRALGWSTLTKHIA